ncbi:hypothetical protein JW905_01980 [bacterium]|nr:hypothetical protein [candidate division CSSED10-310 bacterium]
MKIARWGRFIETIAINRYQHRVMVFYNEHCPACYLHHPNRYYFIYHKSGWEQVSEFAYGRTLESRLSLHHKNIVP